MKRIYYYFAVLAVLCVGIISAWVYTKYIRSSAAAMLTYPVQRGSISEIVKSRGEVVAQHDFQLGFPVSGQVLRTTVAEGAAVKAGTVLMRLDATAGQAQLAQLQANLAKLMAGASSADIAATHAKLADARVAMLDSIQDAYTTCDDAIHNQADRMMFSGRSSDPLVDPQLPASTELKDEIEDRRVTMETLLTNWNTAVSQLTTDSDLENAAAQARDYTSQIKFFLDRLAVMINSVTAPGMLSQTTLDGYKTNVSTARTNVVAAASALSTALAALNTATNNLAMKVEPARPEDIAALQAQIMAAQQSIANATLRAPANGTVVKFVVLPGEQYALGSTAVTFYSPDLKITSDISELDIGKVRVNSPTTIALDAFPDQTFTGKVVSIDPQEIDKEGDKYYRVNMLFDQVPPGARSGMSTDVSIILQTKDGVLMVPAFLVYSRDSVKYVKHMVDGTPVERSVTVGISDGENIEILSGLSEGDVVAASTD